MRALFMIFIAAIVSGCVTTSDLTRVTSEPTGALIMIEGYGQCETPCTIKLDEPRLVTVAKAGYEKQRFVIVPGRPKVAVILELAAPTEAVESNTLPEL